MPKYPIKLTNNNQAKPNTSCLTNKNNSPFILSFRYALEKQYKFTHLSMSDIKIFQNFLDKVSNMTFADVDRLYRRKTDKDDIYDNKQVIHYAISKSFRIHGIFENNQVFVVKLDPNHKFHA